MSRTRRPGSVREDKPLRSTCLADGPVEPHAGRIVAFALPQLMAAERVPEGKIAAITAVAVSPSFW